ncbi:hypothetical protein M8818_003750 [Zalaria obscura]|uniref:Uncharacterized protein n=1 Tax=Zalaria obscura TaxID=2024903 RepID=A0ACC3SDZ6_9PEZI
MLRASEGLFNALIRTHHITSRKKVAKLKQAADAHDVFALLRYGGAPGIMYVEGEEKGVRQWVDAVHNLRYKDYQLVSRPALLEREGGVSSPLIDKRGLYEMDTVKAFGHEMQCRAVYGWWRRGMGYAS